MYSFALYTLQCILLSHVHYTVGNVLTNEQWVSPTNYRFDTDCMLAVRR